MAIFSSKTITHGVSVIVSKSVWYAQYFTVNVLGNNMLGGDFFLGVMIISGHDQSLLIILFLHHMNHE
jgi:hypothetical protein